MVHRLKPHTAQWAILGCPRLCDSPGYNLTTFSLEIFYWFTTTQSHWSPKLDGAYIGLKTDHDQLPCVIQIQTIECMLPDCDILYLVVTRSTWQVCKPGNMVVFPCFSCGILRGISKFRTLCQVTSSTSATSTSTSGTSSSTSSTSLSTSSSTTSVSSSSSLTTSSTTGGWVGFFALPDFWNRFGG